MKRIFIITGIILSLAACSQSDDNIVCGDYDVTMQMVENRDAMHATINGDEVSLDLVPSADGAKYVGILNDTTVTLWNHGREWTLFFDDDESIECK